MADDKDDAQVKNELGAIKAQLTATANPAELARLASAAAGLAASTNNPELLEQIKGVQAAISKKEETAEQNISSKIAAENLGTLEQQDPEVVRKQQEHEERGARIEKNWVEYEKIEKDFRQQLKENSDFLDQVINSPESLTEEQKRLARGEYASEEERLEAERKAQQYINGAKLSYELQKDFNHSIEHEKEQLKDIKKKIEAEPDPQKKEALYQKQQQHQTRIDSYQEKLDKRINPAIAELDQERQKLIKATEKSPEFAKESIKKHFQGSIDKYKEMAAKNPNYKGLEEMYELVKKAELEKDLGIEKEIAEYQKSTAAKIETSEKITSPINQKEPAKSSPVKEDSALTAQEKYGKGNIPPEVKNNITEKKIVKLGYENDLQAIKGKLPAIQASQPKSAQIASPAPTPAIGKFAAREAAMAKKNEGRNI